MMTNEISWRGRQDARREQMLRELASDLADRVEAGEMTDADANAHLAAVADRWMRDA